METIALFQTPEGRCGYLPDQLWQLEYEIVHSMTAAEYAERMQQGWRRFGRAMFRPQCRHCTACQSLRVQVAQFQPNRSQQRTWKQNLEDLVVVLDEPHVTRTKLRLYDRFHAFQSFNKGWPLHAPKDAEDYTSSFVDNPFPTQEWNYYLGKRLVAVGYVDDLPGCLSAIYFYYDPELRERSLGVFNVLSVLHYAKARQIPFVYLGYFVEGCQSLEYKANYQPNETLTPSGTWLPFRDRRQKSPKVP
jgi:arginine-tRNA-protein transferase